jgi:hypothetical protein
VGGLRYFGGAVAFGFAAVWILASLAAALVCLLSAIAGYGVVFVAERTRAKRAVRTSSPGVSSSSLVARPVQTPEMNDLSLWADALNSSLGHVYEPAVATSPLAREAEYGWPGIEDTVVATETLH